MIKGSYKIGQTVILKGNPLCRGVISARRCPGRYQFDTYYEVLMDNGTVLRDRPEWSLEAIRNTESAQIIEFTL